MEVHYKKQLSISLFILNLNKNLEKINLLSIYS